MKITGFTFIKNALVYDYPIVEAIKSILPICNDFVVAVGKSKDETLDLISKIDNSKIKIIETDWDESLRKGGQLLAVETNKAFANVPAESDWAFYIQGDEVVHEKDLNTIYNNMVQYKDEIKVDGLLFNYLHFYGSYDYVGDASYLYKKEIRVIRNNKSIYSFKDAMGFRKGNNEKLNVIPVDAYIYHYGWIREPEAMQKKQENFHKYWHDDKWIETNFIKADAFDYLKHVRELKLFSGEHPEVMKERIKKKNWKFDYDISKSRKTLKDKSKELINKIFGIDFNYKNYKIVKL
jgi:hypothetical protein